MTSMADCIQRAIDARALHPVHGRAAQAEFEQLRARYETTMPPAQAAASAAADLKEATRLAVIGTQSQWQDVVDKAAALAADGEFPTQRGWYPTDAKPRWGR